MTSWAARSVFGQIAPALILLSCAVVFGRPNLRFPLRIGVRIAKSRFVQNVGLENISIPNNASPDNMFCTLINLIPVCSRIRFSISVWQLKTLVRGQHMWKRKSLFVLSFYGQGREFFFRKNLWRKESGFNDRWSLSPIFYRENIVSHGLPSVLPPEENPRPIDVFQGISTHFGGISVFLGNFDILPHPFLLSQYENYLQDSYDREYAREHYEQAVVYFFYSLRPIIVLMPVVMWLALNGPDWFLNVGRGLVCSGFVYLFLGTLLIRSGLLL